MAKLTINGKEVEIADGTDLIEATRQQDQIIPHFCYHPGLSVAGNCRMCLVEIEGARKLEIACNTVVRDGMVVHTESEKVKKARQGVMEFLLLNHPIDCPICDCAGECSLQDYYMEHDGKASRLDEGKNKKRKVQDIGTHVVLDKERCILCSRCVRFCDEVSETSELGIFGRGSTEEIGLVEGMRLENDYSGCVVDICPVGALTDKDFRFSSRPWFLDQTETVCAGCSQGCNVILNTNKNPYNKIGKARAYRIYPRDYKTETNDFWICDEGRYTYKTMDSNLRYWAKANGERKTPDFVESEAAAGLQKVLAENPAKAAILLSPQLTNEELWSWKWLAKELGIKQISIGEDLSPKGKADDYLMKEDKTPNTRGAQDLGLAGQSGLRTGRELLEDAAAGKLDVLIVIEQESALLETASAKTNMFLHIAAHQLKDEKQSALALPRAQYVEQQGTFTNVHGRVQLANKAMDALGDSRSAWQIAFALGERLGKKVPATTSEEIFVLLAKETAAYSGMDYNSLGKQGLLSGAAKTEAKA